MSDCPLKEAARDAPHYPALDTLTFSELDTLADTQTKKLHGLGIQPGDRIAVCHLPKEQFIPLLFATWRLGASLCPLNTRLPQIETALSRLKPRFFFDTMHFFSRSDFRILTSAFLFTSGSTGNPKIAILSQQNLIQSALLSLKTLEFQPQDRWLLSLPLYHVGGIGIVLRCILGRGTIVLSDKDPHVTHLSYVPAQLYRAWPLYPRLKCLLLGGAPITSFPEHLPIFPSYGLTEMSSLVAVAKKSNNLKPLPGREVRIAADGEIWVRGACRFQAYWGEKTPFDEEGWFPTGDLGKLNDDTLTILGRKDWMFISGGENIQPEEIESYLLQIPGVLDAAVCPISDPEFGKRPIAFLQATHFNPNQARTFLSQHLPKYKIPVAFHLLDEMPKIGFKIDRSRIFFISTSYYKSIK